VGDQTQGPWTRRYGPLEDVLQPARPRRGRRIDMATGNEQFFQALDRYVDSKMDVRALKDRAGAGKTGLDLSQQRVHADGRLEAARRELRNQLGRLQRLQG